MNQHDNREFELHSDHRPPTVEIADLEYTEQNGQAVIHHPDNQSAFLGGNTRAFTSLEDAR